MSTNTPPASNAIDSAANHRKIIVAVDDLFFLAKIQETARQLGVKIETVKSGQELLEKAKDELIAAPNLIILDLNSVALKPISTISRIRQLAQWKKTSVIGFLSHLQAELKVKAQEAGCDMVMPRSAFSQNLPALLRRHGLPQPG